MPAFADYCERPAVFVDAFGGRTNTVGGTRRAPPLGRPCRPKSISTEKETVKSFRYRLAMGVFVLGSFVGVANAEQVIVYEGPLDSSKQEITADFAVNRELGRAWIDVQIQSTDFVGAGVPDRAVIRKLVDGLYYDSARKQVLYKNATGLIVCAEDDTFLWMTSLKSTGKCRLTSSIEERKVDDGFNVHQQTVAEVVFDVQSPAPQQAAASERMSR